MSMSKAWDVRSRPIKPHHTQNDCQYLDVDTYNMCIRIYQSICSVCKHIYTVIKPIILKCMPTTIPLSAYLKYLRK